MSDQSKPPQPVIAKSELPEPSLFEALKRDAARYRLLAASFEIDEAELDAAIEQGKKQL